MVNRASRIAATDRTTFAYDLRLLLDALHVERADVVGTSLGSLIAQAFAENWPERTRRLVLQSSTGGPLPACESEPTGEAAFDFRNAILALRDPIDPESPFMIAWYTSTAPVDAEFLRRQRRDAAAIPVRVWLAILDQGLNLRDLQADLQTDSCADAADLWVARTICSARATAVRCARPCPGPRSGCSRASATTPTGRTRGPSRP